jgi:hypothetical protein
MIGLEAEYFVRNKENKLVYPSSSDAFPLIGEARGEPSVHTSEVIGNLLKSLLFEEVQLKRFTTRWIDFTGHAEITPEEYADAMKKMGNKEVPKCKNIYGTSLIGLSDQVIKRGKVVKVNLSAGLHIHFSSQVIKEGSYTKTEYEEIDLPLGAFNPLLKDVTVYKKTNVERCKPIVVKANRLTLPAIHHIVKKLDEEILSRYKSTVKLKYRKDLNIVLYPLI